MIHNRIERNLKAVSSMLLVSIPQDESIPLEVFVQKQEKFIKEQGDNIKAVNEDNVLELTMRDVLGGNVLGGGGTGKAGKGAGNGSKDG